MTQRRLQYMPKAISQLVDKNQDRFETKKRFTLDDARVHVDLYDSMTETAYIVQKPVFNSDYKYSQMLTQSRRVLTQSDIERHILPRYFKA